MLSLFQFFVVFNNNEFVLYSFGCVGTLLKENKVSNSNVLDQFGRVEF